MSIETEVKIALDKIKADEIYSFLGKPKWRRQRNYVFCLGGNLFRLRNEEEKYLFTIKGKNIGDNFNEREEIECEIPKDFFEGFEEIGDEIFYYEKIRARKEINGCEVCLDEFFGKYFIEVEGNKENIEKVLDELKLNDFPNEKRSYLEILKGGRN